MQWTQEYPFILSLSYHGGALVAVYPYDGGVNDSIYYSSTPDDVAFRNLASVYSMAHRRMSLGKSTCTDTFTGGITNGNAWYPVHGGMMDWNYLVTSCMEVTVELDCHKYPATSSLSGFWHENKLSLLSFVAQVLRSLRGYTIDGSTGRALGQVSIHVVNNTRAVQSTAHLGEYWRLLPPTGSFLVWASKEGYFSTSVVAVDAADLPNVRHRHANHLNFTLWPNRTAGWSANLDFDIALNRLPQYFSPIGTVREAIQTMTEASTHPRFYAVHNLSDGGDGDYFAVQLSVGHSIPRTSNATVDTSDLVQGLPSRLRVLLLAGTHSEDLVTTEMFLRLLRHYITGIDRLESSVAHLLTSQIILVPFLNGSRIPEQMLHTSRATGDDFHHPPVEDNYCQDPLNATAAASSPDSLKQLIKWFSPHLILVLETGSSSLAVGETHESVTGAATRVHRAVPIYPADTANSLRSDLMKRLAEQYTLGASSADDDQYATSCQPKPLFTASRVEWRQRLAAVIADATGTGQQHSLAISLTVAACYLPACRNTPPQTLPELWHSTLLGIDRLLSAASNLSFCGTLLVEHSAALPGHRSHLIDGRLWTAIPSARLTVRFADFFQQKQQQHRIPRGREPDGNASSEHDQLAIEASTGHFCQLMPIGEFLVVAAVDQAGTGRQVAYEKAAMVVSFQVDQYNGIFPILLERELVKIDFSRPSELGRQLELLASEGSGCGTLSSIGTSNMGKPIHLFEMGANITRLPSTGFSETRQLAEEADWVKRLSHSSVHNTSVSDSREAPVPPRVLMVGNLHGRDRLTPQLLVNFVKMLCENRGRRSAVDRMLSSVRLAVLPIPDPDGLSANWVPVSPGDAHQFCPASPRLWNQLLGDDDTYAGLNHANSVDLWQELIELTRSQSVGNDPKWWWETLHGAEDPLARLQPETKALALFLRIYTPTGVITFPSDTQPAIDYGVDPSESKYARERLRETYDWLRFLGTIISPSLQQPTRRCQLPPTGLQQPTAPPRDRRRRPWDQVDLADGEPSDRLSSTGAAALALSLASVSPGEARARVGAGRYTSLSYAPPLPLLPPVSLGLSLCPACQQAGSLGVARVWTDFRLASLLVGLVEYISMTAAGSFGLLGQVLSASSGQPLPDARIHVDYVRSELSTGPPEQRGFFRLPLPPGQYRLTLRAAGYYDLVQTVAVNVSRQPPRLFRMTPVGSGWSPAAVNLFTVLGYSLLAILCVSTAWWSWRWCCQPRLPYASVRRKTVTSAAVVAGGGTKLSLRHGSAASSQARDNRGAYHLVPMATSGSDVGVEHEDEEDWSPSEALLEREDPGRSESDLVVVANETDSLETHPVEVKTTGGRWPFRKPLAGRQFHRKNMRDAKQDDRENLLSETSRGIEKSIGPNEDGLEEVDLV